MGVPGHGSLPREEKEEEPPLAPSDARLGIQLRQISIDSSRPPLLFQLGLHPFHTSYAPKGAKGSRGRSTEKLLTPRPLLCVEAPPPQDCGPQKNLWSSSPLPWPQWEKKFPLLPSPFLPLPPTPEGGGEASGSPGHRSSVCCGSQETNTPSHTHTSPSGSPLKPALYRRGGGRVAGRRLRLGGALRRALSHQPISKPKRG